ncbi:unnamed protein product, partial [marine sediment metagenome]
DVHLHVIDAQGCRLYARGWSDPDEPPRHRVVDMWMDAMKATQAERDSNAALWEMTLKGGPSRLSDLDAARTVVALRGYDAFTADARYALEEDIRRRSGVVVAL